MPRPVKLADLLLSSYVLVCALALVWPVFARVDAAAGDGRRLLGLPFALGWSAVWVVVTFLVVGAYYLATEGRRDPRA